MPASFIDTNVLVYLASADADKAERAERVLARPDVTVSVQILNELTNVARRKMRLSWAETNSFLATIRALVSVHPLTLDIHCAGLALAERYGLSIYDAMVVASALDADCDALWSEDMQDGMVIDGRLRIANPFNV